MGGPMHDTLKHAEDVNEIQYAGNVDQEYHA
jgi:hypothetical protein